LIVIKKGNVLYKKSNVQNKKVLSCLRAGSDQLFKILDFSKMLLYKNDFR